MEAAKTIKMYPVSDHVKQNQDTGFVCLYRSIKKHWLWQSSRKKTKFEAWVDLILLANHDPYKEPIGYDLIELKKGQILTSQDKLSKEWFWDRSAVRGFLAQLQKDRMISLNVTSKFTIITICNYASYNDLRPTKRQPANNGTTSSQHIQPLEPLSNNSTPPPKPVYKFSHNGFFDRQLSANAGQPELDKYQKLVEFLHAKDEEGEYVFSNVLAIKKQISFKDYLTLKETEKAYKHRSLKEVLESMENKAGVEKKYKNVFLTANNWLKNDFNDKK
jgi:hypothetical protein